MKNLGKDSGKPTARMNQTSPACRLADLVKELAVLGEPSLPKVCFFPFLIHMPTKTLLITVSINLLT